MKTEQKRTELSSGIFVFNFFSKRETDTKPCKQIRKQTWTEYGAEADEKRMIKRTKKPFELCRETQATQVN
jgi:hypothetical protein